MKRYIVFDLDGTLVESLPGIAEGVNRALAAMGRAGHTRSAVRRMIGQGARHLCACALGYADEAAAPAEELQTMHEHFRREYPHCWQGSYTVPFPEVRIMLSRLAAQGARMAVLSNKPHEVTAPMVQKLFPTTPFSPVIGHSAEFPRKPSPIALQHIANQWGVDVSQLTLVGDSLHDAHTAANAGCGLALVAWGYADVGPLASTQAPLFGTVDELLRYLLADDSPAQ